MRTDAGLILEEPAPCDDCTHAQQCSVTGSACQAFSAYVNGEPWDSAGREPALWRGDRLGLKMTDADRERLLMLMK